MGPAPLLSTALPEGGVRRYARRYRAAGFTPRSAEKKATSTDKTTLTPEEATALGDWLMKKALPKRLSKVKVGNAVACRLIALQLFPLHISLLMFWRARGADHNTAVDVTGGGY